MGRAGVELDGSDHENDPLGKLRDRAEAVDDGSQRDVPTSLDETAEEGRGAEEEVSKEQEAG